MENEKFFKKHEFFKNIENKVLKYKLTDPLSYKLHIRFAQFTNILNWRQAFILCLNNSFIIQKNKLVFPFFEIDYKIKENKFYLTSYCRQFPNFCIADHDLTWHFTETVMINNNSITDIRNGEYLLYHKKHLRESLKILFDIGILTDERFK